MNFEEIIPKLAALMYYQSPKEGEAKKTLFEKLKSEQSAPFFALAESVLEQVDKLNLNLVPRGDAEKEKEAEALLKRRIESTVADFFAGITVWKKGAIPQAELTARIYQVWATL